jgi:uncharacterized DUF497 family protein
VRARSNQRKHGVTFEEAATCFEDPHALCFADLAHVERLVLIGMSSHDRLLFTIYAEVERNVIRIISARRSESRERRRYHEENE